MPGFYASCCPAWRTQCQVSGRSASEAKQSSLSPRLVSHHRENSPEWFPPRFPRRKHAPWRLKWAPASIIGISRAAGSPTCARNKICHRKFWRRGCNARDWTSAATCSPTLKSDAPKSTMNSSSDFQRVFARSHRPVFPQEVQDLRRQTCRPRRRPFPENPVTQCQQLTNQPHRV